MNATDDEIERDIRWIRDTYRWNYKDIAQALGTTVWRVYKVLNRKTTESAA